MHFLSIVQIPTDTEHSPEAIDAAVGQVLAPYSEDLDGPAAFYDWYQIGGRWSGHFDGYNPEEDPANYEPCHLCNSTGVRRDQVGVTNGMDVIQITAEVYGEKHPRLGQIGWCNGCHGTGSRQKWATQWGFHRGDVALKRDLPADVELPYTLVTDLGPAHQDDDEALLKARWSELDGEAVLVVVDYHS